MNKYLFLICTLTAMNYEINNAATAAQSPASQKYSKVIQSKEDYVEFLDYFFTTHTGHLESICLPEFKRVVFETPRLKSDPNNKCRMSKKRNFFESLFSSLLGKQNSISMGYKALNNIAVNYKKEISELVYFKYKKYFKTPAIMDKFLKIIFCEKGGIAEFRNSELYLEYDDEHENSLKGELKQLIDLQQSQLQMHDKMVVQLGVIQKLLEKRQFVSTSVQTEAQS
ncbi:MAG TPA: hypothetical protein VLG50_03930 [Candidatus Saccharimonadales bacterium]|nr:hypothetical protein [Candidatus Saccharimonadales bacterium]